MSGQEHQHLEFIFAQPEFVPSDEHSVRALIDAKIADRDDTFIVFRNRGAALFPNLVRQLSRTRHTRHAESPSISNPNPLRQA